MLYQRLDQRLDQNLPPITDEFINGAFEQEQPKPVSKKERVLKLYEQGITDVAALGRQTATSPSYVADVLRQAGLLTGYFDLYTSTERLILFFIN